MRRAGESEGVRVDERHDPPASRSQEGPSQVPISVGYVVGQFPAISHTFILREVEALRRLGARVETFSIWRADRKPLLSEADRAAAQTTYAVLPPRWGELTRAHLAAVLRHPLRYGSTLMRSMRLSPPGLRAHLWRLFYFVEAIVVWRECRRRGIRHLHSQFASQATDVALLISHFERGRSEPFTWSLAIHGPVEFQDTSINRLTDKARDADLIICISDFARSQVMALVEPEHWNKIQVVHCGLEITRFPRKAERPGSDTFSVLSVGRLVALKGHPVTLRAVARLRQTGIPAELTMIGDGPQRQTLERLTAELGIEDAVSFQGSVGQEEILSHFARADAFCLPSFAEGIPVVLMEAMATGTPVVASRIAGIPELVEDGESGFLVSPGRPDQVADALAALADAPERRIAMADSGRDKVEREFDVDTSALQLVAHFASVAGR